MKSFAVTLGLDAQAFNDCLDSGKYTQIVQQDTNFGRQMGVQSTPTFLVNGSPVVGAEPFETFQTLIEQKLQGQ